MKRRILAGLVATLAVAAALSCSGEPSEKEQAAADPCYVGPLKDEPIPIVPSPIRPRAFDASKLQTATPIKHVVFIMKENRTFDNLFGSFPGANGATTGMDGDQSVALREHCFPQVFPRDIKHDLPVALANWNQGQMDGFGSNDYTSEWAYVQATQEDIPNYWHWAQNFTLSDNFFSSVLGPSFPNHLYSIAGTAAGTTDNPVPPTGRVVVKPTLGGVYTKTWGCDAPKGTYVLVGTEEGETKEKFPCFKMRVLPDALEDAGVPWAYYGADGTQNGYFWVSPDYIDHIRNDPVTWKTHVYGVDQIVPDIEDGRLPPVTWVTSMYWQSDHVGNASICLGENWTTQIVNAIMESPMWKDTVIFISWDDWGGLYDHVPPPKGLGFRVPLLTISPYAKRGYIDSRVGHFASILGFIEYNWGLEPLASDVPTTNRLTQNFDFEQSPLPPDPLPLRTDCQGYKESTENKVDQH